MGRTSGTLETHPKTGAAQFVEIRERVQESLSPNTWSQKRAQRRYLFASLPDSELLWLRRSSGVVTRCAQDANEETLLNLADHLPKEAAEALLDLATGVTPKSHDQSWFPLPSINAGGGKGLAAL